MGESQVACCTLLVPRAGAWNDTAGQEDLGVVVVVGVKLLKTDELCHVDQVVNALRPSVAQIGSKRARN